MIIDMDVETDGQTSPGQTLVPVPEDKELGAVAGSIGSPLPLETPVGETAPRRTGLGSLMQSAKRDVQVPEFDMSAFGF